MSDLLEIAPRPRVDAQAAATVAREKYGIEGPVRELGSHQDRNYLIEAGDGSRVIKIANKGWGSSAIEAQNAALTHIANASIGIATPVPIAGLDGCLLYSVVDGPDSLPLRALSFVDGTPLSECDYFAPAVVARIGAIAGRVCDSLSSFDHPGLGRVVQWDLRRAHAVIEALAPSIGDPEARASLESVVAEAFATLESVRARLPVQAIHGDLSDDNMVGHYDESGQVYADGVIDFGDLARSYRVGEIAVLCAALLRHMPDDPFAVLPAIESFNLEVALSDDEITALWPLVILRGAVLVVSGEHQARLDPDNPSVLEPLASEWAIFRRARAVPLALAEASVRAALGFETSRAQREAADAVASGGRLFPAVRDVALIDLSSTSEELNNGRFQEPTIERTLLHRAGHAATKYAEPRLTRSRLLESQEPATYALGIDLALPPQTEAVAPWECTLAWSTSTALALDTPAGRLHLNGVQPIGGIRPDSIIPLGAPVGHVDESGDVHVQLCVDPALSPPDFATATTAPGWLALCPDPSALLGLKYATPAAIATDAAAALMDQRETSLANVQEHYYRQPMQIERGWREHMFDTSGRAYVDMVNNVAAIGHAHPRLADAVERQMHLLNTNSRFHYAAIAEFSQRLAAISPDGLDEVFLVNSGSEAVDLALRIARVATGRRDVIAVREAYHGWTIGSDAVTTSLYDNPSALASRPDWVHLADAPNPFRGRFRGPESGPDYVREMRVLISQMQTDGKSPAAFICEPVLGNAGGVVLPDGYLAGCFDAVQAAGGLCIADEVQVGYGRLGHYWWAFDQAGAMPDIITVAKSMGNGYPLGAVITTRAIAEAFAEEGSFFSSAGGSPVSCVVGMTVLDVIRDEGLQTNAARVGDHLGTRLRELADRYPIVGTVHGMGFYQGVELVRDHETLEPATAECYAICERMRELGVIVQPTGERANVLKMKPPMCLTMDAADFVVDCLDQVLRDGW